MRTPTRPSEAPRLLGRRATCAVQSCHHAAAREMPLVLAGSRRGVGLCERHAPVWADAPLHA
jgi:hypothetical protein